jgi:spore coat polysaccharide biosynthesis protein SpsF
MSDITPVVAVIQARMSSSRLPGKVLMPIAGKPLLWHLVHRLRQCRTVDSIVIATSTDARDDALEALCAQEGILCVRGSLDNVLDRYRLAAERAGAGTLLRITGDSPLIDPGFIDYLVSGFAGAGADYVQLEPGARCAHEGVDVFSRRALDWLITRASDDLVAREHVTSWFKLHPEAVKTATLPEYAPLATESARLSVDTADDLAFIRAVYDRLGAAPGEVALTDVLKLLRDEPRYREINAHVRQKAITQRERHAIVCCQGGSSAGLGHVRRSLSLARALRDIHGIGVTFAAPEEIAAMISMAGFTVRSDKPPAALAAEQKFDLAVIDVKDWLSRADVAAIAAEIPVVAVIDDGSDRRLAATHAYYPPVPQARELSWAGSSCKPRLGWEWCILGFDPARVARRPEAGRIVVSMGGADPSGLTGIALEAMQQVPVPFQADFVIGSAFAAPQDLASRIDRAGPAFHARTGVSNPAELFARSELALVAFGVTAYELAALGVPALYLPISDDDVRSASAFFAAGIGEALPQNATPGQIAQAVTLLLGDKSRRSAMAAAGPLHNSGKGAANIAADLTQAVDAG